MSYREAVEPRCQDIEGAIDLSIRARSRDLGGFSVRRVLPASRRRMVGPFIFFDHMGPADFPPGEGIQVRPHPHIGLATITWLFEGEIMHRDSLGFEQLIRPGEVNLMTAGSGIAHSERAGADIDTLSRLHGIQSWLALPDGKEEIEPAFEHIAADELPRIERDGVRLCVIMGEAYGKTSPVRTFSPTLYVELEIDAGASIEVPAEQDELAAYVATGSVRIDGHDYTDGTLAVAHAGRGLVLEALRESRVMVIGGAALGERHIWWNFVSSSQERIEQAKADWREGRFDKVAGDDEFIPLPE